MIKDKDIELLSHMRKNAREKVTEISRKMKMPVTTIYSKIDSHEKKGVMKKHVTLVDFSKLGYYLKALVAFRVDKEKKFDLQKYLTNVSNVNSLYKINMGHDFMAEFIFEDAAKLHEFLEDTASKFNVEEYKIFNVIEELKKEEFLSK